jgi:hypothetical protein
MQRTKSSKKAVAEPKINIGSTLEKCPKISVSGDCSET